MCFSCLYSKTVVKIIADNIVALNIYFGFKTTLSFFQIRKKLYSVFIIIFNIILFIIIS